MKVTVVFYYHHGGKPMPSRRSTHSDQEWIGIITTCRQSGLSDSDWCRINDIPSSSFYNAVSRLRRKACKLPEPTAPTSETLDLTTRQDVVRIDIEPTTTEAPSGPASAVSPMVNTVPNLDNAHTIEILSPGLSILINNQAEPSLVKALVSALRGK